MKGILAGILVAGILVVSFVHGNQDECTEERALGCVENLLNAMLEDDSSEEDVCRELRSSTDCLKRAVDDCIEEEDRDAEINEGLEELERLLRENCNGGGSDSDNDDDDEIQKCFEENQDYIFQCVQEGTTQAMIHLMEGGEVDENKLTCVVYGMVAGCMVERTREKCGKTAATMMDEELSDIPEEIKEACEAVGGFDAHIFNLLEDKRRK